MLQVNLANFSLFQRQVVIRPASDALPRGESGFDLPELLSAVGQAQCSASGFSYQDDFAGKDTGQVQVITALRLPKRLPVPQVQTMDGTAVRCGEDDLAILNDR